MEENKNLQPGSFIVIRDKKGKVIGTEPNPNDEATANRYNLIINNNSDDTKVEGKGEGEDNG